MYLFYFTYPLHVRFLFILIVVSMCPFSSFIVSCANPQAVCAAILQSQWRMTIHMHTVQLLLFTRETELMIEHLCIPAWNSKSKTQHIMGG